ncbi:ComEC/Rec2 family competence protein [Prevotella aurantiaca]|jgi:ComEC/Rec2-like protein|uniref:ComEC/Rec2 family competence protein n=1 Tax=Prevotella aurantiaca TaxID=596085 RepID=UPI002888FABC|nr:ComEC/Rec2 family competence protein [Prevotella aurantiaca]
MKQSIAFNMNPLVKVAVALIVGMTLGQYSLSMVPLWAWFAFAVMCLLVVFLCGKRRILSSWALLFSVASVGGLLMTDTELEMQKSIPTEPLCYDAVLLTEPVRHGKVVKVDLAIPMANEIVKVKASILCDTVSENYKRLHVGDGITALSQLEEPVNFRDSEFDYARWLRLHGFDGETFIYYRNWKKTSVDLSSFGYIDRTLIELKRIKQQWMQTYGRVGLDGQSVAVATAMTLGDKQLISKEVKDDYSISGASHVLALSGLHLGIIYAFFLFGFNLCKGIPYLNLFVRYHLSELFVLLLIWLYALLVDFSPSVVRSATMITVYSIVGLLNRDKFSLNTLALTAIILLVVRPQNLWDVGFQMSFIAVLFIILFVPLLDGLFSRKQLQRHWLLRWVWGLVMASVAAQLGTAPLVAFYFGRFSCYFLLSNFIVVPCAIVILYAALLLLFCFFAPQVQLLVGKALMFVVGTMNTALHWVAHLKGASVEELHPNVLQVLLSYVFLFCLWYLFSFFSNRTNLK